MDRVTKHGNAVSMILPDVELFRHLSVYFLSRRLTLRAAYEILLFFSEKKKIANMLLRIIQRVK